VGTSRRNARYLPDPTDATGVMLKATLWDSAQDPRKNAVNNPEATETENELYIYIYRDLLVLFRGG